MRRVVGALIGIAIAGAGLKAQAVSDRVILERTACFGTCPVYTVEIARSGRVTFTGREHVLKTNATRQLGPHAFDSLISYFTKSGFFQIDSAFLPGKPGCMRAATDHSSATLSVVNGRRNKTVAFYYGCLGDLVHTPPDNVSKIPGGLPRLIAIALHVDSVAGTDEWAAVPGGARTKPVHHYVFVGRDREQLRANPPFLSNKVFEGVQITYPWGQLEKGKDTYDFTSIREDLEFLKSKNKRLWIQLSDVSFSPSRTNVPQYLITDTVYHGGVARQYSTPGDDDSKAVVEGFVARRWDPAVQERFAKLMLALGKEFDGKIEGINLPETSITFGQSGRLFPAGYTRDSYPQAVVVNFTALKRAFPASIAMQYANFIPGEWRPTNDKLYLSRVYGAAARANVGVGGPDLMPFQPGQLGSSYPLIRSLAGRVPTGIAVQDGNLEEMNPNTHRRVTAAELLEFALKYLKVDYIFWGTQEPFFSNDVVPTLSHRK